MVFKALEDLCKLTSFEGIILLVPKDKWGSLIGSKGDEIKMLNAIADVKIDNATIGDSTDKTSSCVPALVPSVDGHVHKTLFCSKGDYCNFLHFLPILEEEERRLRESTPPPPSAVVGLFVGPL